MTEWHPEGLAVLALVIGCRVAADWLDRNRIREHIEQSGGRVVNITWNPFGKGWFGSNTERLYEVTYRTRRGRTITATCKTSLWSGVYWTSDAPPAEFSKPASEATECLACHATIPAGQTRCPKCGWSYTQ